MRMGVHTVYLWLISCSYMAETNTILKSNYPTIKNKFFKMRGRGFQECHTFLCVHRKECVINI